MLAAAHPSVRAGPDGTNRQGKRREAAPRESRFDDAASNEGGSRYDEDPQLRRRRRERPETDLDSLDDDVSRRDGDSHGRRRQNRSSRQPRQRQHRQRDSEDDARFRALLKTLDLQRAPELGHDVSFLYPEHHAHIYAGLKSRVVDIHAHDWEHLTQLGYTWRSFYRLVYNYTHVRIGNTVWLTPHVITQPDFKKFLQFDTVSFYFVNDQEMDRHAFVAQTIPVLRGLLQIILPSTQRKPLFVEATIVLKLLADNREHSVHNLNVLKSQLADPSVCQWLVSAVSDLSVSACTFPDRGHEFCDALADSSTPSSVTKLTLENLMHMDHRLLAAAITSMHRLQVLSVDYDTLPSNDDGSTQWDPIIRAAAESDSLERVYLTGAYEEGMWTDGVVALLRNPSITQIGYRLRSSADLSHLRTVTTLRILAAVQQNKTISYLQVDPNHIVPQLFDDKITPITVSNKSRRQIISTCDAILKTDGYAVLNGLLCHRTVRYNPDLLFEVLSCTHEMVTECRLGRGLLSSSFHGGRNEGSDCNVEQPALNSVQRFVRTEIQQFCHRLLPKIVMSHTDHTDLQDIKGRLKDDFVSVLDEVFTELTNSSEHEKRSSFRERVIA